MESFQPVRATLKRLTCALAVAATLGAAASAHALTFNLTSTGNANADAGFQTAANFWQGVFNDPVTVNITTGFQSLTPGFIGWSIPTSLSTTFSAVKAALALDSTSADDATMVAGLPIGDSYSRYINYTADSPYGINSLTPYLQSGVEAMGLTTANAKAIGLVAGTASGEDGQITFSNLFNFDFDPTDGIGTGLYDFVGIAVHEIGHVMGFMSGVDTLTSVDGDGTTAFYDKFTSLLDFTRCSAASRAAGGNMDWTADKRAKDFAIDGNCTALVSNAWSTGEFPVGDGHQASHWKDALGIGIMDPTTAPPGNLNVVTARDIQALDVIGWTLESVESVKEVPEPSTMLLLGLGIIGVMGLKRKFKN